MGDDRAEDGQKGDGGPGDGAAALLASLSAKAGLALAGQVRALVDSGKGPPSASVLRDLQVAAVKELLAGIASADPRALGPPGAAAFAPTGRFLAGAVTRMAGPSPPDPTDVATRLFARQPAEVADRGMLAGPGFMLPEEVRRLLRSFAPNTED